MTPHTTAKKPGKHVHAAVHAVLLLLLEQVSAAAVW